MNRDERLIAYVDGELDDAEQATFSAEMAADPALAERVAQQLALRERVRAAYAPVLDEPVPERLLAVLRGDVRAELRAELRAEPPDEPRAEAQAKKVFDLALARAARRAPPAAVVAPRRWQLPQWGALAASLFVGVIGGYGLLGANEPLSTARDGALVAGGVLAQALSQQLASAPAAASGDAPGNALATPGGVQIGVSYVATTGELCRSFVLDAAQPLAGLACHEADRKRWRMKLVTPAAPAEGAGPYRMAAGALPPALARAIDESMRDAPLDAAGERAARERGWRP